MNKVIAIVGMCGSGKSIACEYFENKGYKKVYFGGITMEKLKESNIPITPENEKTMREKIREEHGMAAFAILSLPKIDEYLKTNNVVIDGLYSWEELKVVSEKYKDNVIYISIVVDKNIRYNRLENREIRPFNNEQATTRDVTEIENISKAGPIAFADYYILNNGSMEDYIEQLKQLEIKIEKDEK